MKLIQKMVDYIDEELEGAEEYVKCALAHKDDNPTLAKTFYDISADEMKHVNMLHEEVVKIIEAHRREKGEPPAAMLAIWNYMHEKHIERANKVKTYQAQYREG